jgi:hypothetical protein
MCGARSAAKPGSRFAQCRLVSGKISNIAELASSPISCRPNRLNAGKKPRCDQFTRATTPINNTMAVSLQVQAAPNSSTLW